VQYTDHRITVHQQRYYSTYNGARNPRSNAEVIEISKNYLPLLCND